MCAKESIIPRRKILSDVCSVGDAYLCLCKGCLHALETLSKEVSKPLNKLNKRPPKRLNDPFFIFSLKR